MPQATTVHMIRHGHVYNPDGIIYGRLPGFHLSDFGRAQVVETAVYVATLNISSLYISPMLRAQETAEILLTRLPEGTPQHIHEAINEVPFELEGCEMKVAAARNWDLYSGAPAQFPQPSAVAGKVVTFLAELLDKHEGESIALVSHGDVIVFTTLWALGVDLLPSNKHTLDRYGLSDPYPALASVTSLTFETTSTSSLPSVAYTRPYGDKLVDKGSAPK